MRHKFYSLLVIPALIGSYAFWNHQDVFSGRQETQQADSVPETLFPGKLSFNVVKRYKISENFALPDSPDHPLDGIESDPAYHGNNLKQREENEKELVATVSQSTISPKAGAWFTTQFVNPDSTEGKTGWFYPIYWPLNEWGRPFAPTNGIVAAPCPPFCEGDNSVIVNPE